MGLKTKNTFSKAALLSFASAIALATPTIAVAQTGSEAVRPFSSAPQALGDTLVAIGDYFGADVIVSNDLARGLRSPAVSGATSAKDALEQALTGSELAVSRSSGGAFVVSQNTADTSPVPVNVADEIIVTGRFQDSLIDRLPVTVQELPFTLDTISREDIDERNFIRRIDVLDTLPNVQLGVAGTFGNPGFRSRGFNAPILVNNRVINVVSLSGYRDDSFVERYEVLKGPASIALGPVAGGGIINTVTKQPEEADFSDLRFTTDQFGTINGEFDFNDAELFGNGNIGFRLSGAYRDFEFDAEEVGREEFAIRPVVVANYKDTFARLSFAYKNIQGSPNNLFPLFSDGSIPEGFDTDTFFGVLNGFSNQDDIFIDAQVVHNFLDNLQLTLRGSHQSTDLEWQDQNGLYNYERDDGGTGASRSNPVGYAYNQAADLDQNNDFIDAQLQYSFEGFGNQHAIVIGASYQDVTTTRALTSAGRLGPVRFDQIDEPRFGDPTSLPPEEPQRTTSNTLYSVYSEIVIRPIDNLTLIGGLRYDDVDDRLEQPGFLREIVADDLTFRFGASYAISPSINVFASYAEAFTPQQGGRRDGELVGPESSRNFETGLKGQFLDGALDVNLALFSTTRSNVAVRDPENSPTEVFFAAIGKQRNQGVEALININPFAGLNLSLNYGFLDQQLLENLEDGLLPALPDHQVSVFGTYEVGRGLLDGLEFGGGFRYFSSRSSNSSTDFRFPSVTVGDAFVRYPLTEATTLSLNMINVTDELYLESAGANTGTLSGQQSFGAPRTFVFSIRTRF